MTCDLQAPCVGPTPPANGPPSESAMVKLKRDLHSVEQQLSVRRQAIEDHLHIVKRLIEYRAVIIGKMNPPQPEQDAE